MNWHEEIIAELTKHLDQIQEIDEKITKLQELSFALKQEALLRLETPRVVG